MSQGKGQVVSETILGSAIITHDATRADKTRAREMAGRSLATVEVQDETPGKGSRGTGDHCLPLDLGKVLAFVKTKQRTP